MRKWFRRKQSAQPVVIPVNDDWITIPFRFAEAARVSIHTIGNQPEVPPSVRWWIGQWLTAYNSQLVYYMRENYGSDIFPILDRITREVMPQEEAESVNFPDDSWEKWEEQFREE